MKSTGDFMMFFENMVFATVVGGFAIALAACSNDSKEGATAKQGAEAACEHLNGMCASMEGFQKRDCSTSNYDYEKLSPDAKAQADAIMPCIMAAKTCEPALSCVSPPPSDESPRASAKKKAPPAHEAEDACEHINDVCEKERGFETQDCSSSNAEYEKLSTEDKELADDIASCIMEAKTCKTAFQCLQFD